MYSTCLAHIEAKIMDLSLKALLIIFKPIFLNNSRLKFNFNVSITPLRQDEQQKMLKPVQKYVVKINVYDIVRSLSTHSCRLHF